MATLNIPGDYTSIEQALESGIAADYADPDNYILVDEAHTETSGDLAITGAAKAALAAGRTITVSCAQSGSRFTWNPTNSIRMDGDLAAADKMFFKDASLTPSAGFAGSRVFVGFFHLENIFSINSNNIDATFYRASTANDIISLGSVVECYMSGYKQSATSPAIYNADLVSKCTIQDSYGIRDATTVEDTVIVNATTATFNNASIDSKSNCASDDSGATDAPATDCIGNITPNDEFVDISNNDPTLKPTSQLIGAGLLGANIGFDQTTPPPQVVSPYNQGIKYQTDGSLVLFAGSTVADYSGADYSADYFI